MNFFDKIKPIDFLWFNPPIDLAIEIVLAVIFWALIIVTLIRLIKLLAHRKNLDLRKSLRKKFRRAMIVLVIFFILLSLLSLFLNMFGLGIRPGYVKYYGLESETPVLPEANNQ